MNEPCRQCGWPWVERDGLCKSCLQLQANPDPLSKRTSFRGIPFRDMKHLDEVHRIEQIVQYLKDHPGKNVAAMVDSGDGYQDKGDRYIRAVRAKLPTVKIVRRMPGPVKDGETIVFQL